MSMIHWKSCTTRFQLKRQERKDAHSRAMARIAWFYIGLLLCAVLLAACSSSPQQPAQATSTASASAFQTTSKTSDGALVIQFRVTPNRLGTNQFTVTATEASSGQAVSQASVTLFTTMLTMAMGTDQINMQSDGNGHFTADGLLSMSGTWQIRVAVRTPDHVLHEATVQFTTPA